MSLNIFDRILYINLKHRKDRKKSLLKEARNIGIKKLQRVEGAFDLFNGARGCVLSHIRALSVAKPTERTLILEDDVVFIKNRSLITKQLAGFFQDISDKLGRIFFGRALFKGVG